MKNLKNKKGFTIVELVIVIAVIAILAAVLIPTFSGVIEKANKSAALQEARNLYTEYLGSVDNPDMEIDYVEVDGKYYEVNNWEEDPLTAVPTTVGDKYLVKNGDTFTVETVQASQQPVAPATYCECDAETQADEDPADGVCDVCDKEIQG